MSTTPKKPKARRMWMLEYADATELHKTEPSAEKECKKCEWHSGDRPGKDPVAVLDVSDEAALIEVVAKGLHGNDESNLGRGWENMGEDIQSIYKDDARAALTALGVLPKRRGK